MDNKENAQKKTVQGEFMGETPKENNQEEQIVVKQFACDFD